MDDKCFNCGAQGHNLFGYIICDECKSKLGLLSKKTVNRHVELYNDKNESYENEIKRRLEVIEKEYIKKRIKLLHVKAIINGK